MSELFDPGLQPERTELAWRRTALALAVGSLVALRLLPEAFGSIVWSLGGVIGLIGSGALLAASRRRCRAIDETLRAQGDRARMPGGVLLLSLVVGVTVIALVGGVIVVAAVLR
ncbi:DUF202 domain-containing protein [Microbacterium sp. RU33B]|uniref:DUF202 domain-containing protein n=1 Tax=Microbacterium sp. RU33B TaxID=1907390 RepID=UPI0009642A11|nr:DUF202 domain-containing protein [Microbacterium sp. RU33B]SIT66593.1 Uncharacterized membrane protein YidH, DUF202 family [Microbacterium sp. RU33B]